MKQGSNNALKVSIDGLNIANIDSVIFTFKETKTLESRILIQKAYTSTSAEVTYNSTDACFVVGLTQTETKALPKTVYLQAQINYVAGAVDFSEIIVIDVKPALSVVIENE